MVLRRWPRCQCALALADARLSASSAVGQAVANFQTHLGVGTAVAGIAGLGAHTQGLTDFGQTQWLLAVGVAASVLPDIDADDSHPVRVFFALLGLLLGFVAASRLSEYFRLLELALVWVGVWLFVYYALRLFFARLTLHRGLFHSLLMACAIALLVVLAADRWFALEPALSWLAGGFALLGYLTHLVLDEIASVDLLGNRVKRSFGTAIKPFSLRAWPLSLMLLGLLAGGMMLVPDTAPLTRFLNHFDVPKAMSDLLVWCS